jgi:hypothetical protein
MGMQTARITNTGVTKIPMKLMKSESGMQSVHAKSYDPCLLRK